MSGARAGRRAAREPRPPPDAEQAFEIAGRFLGTRPRSRWEVEQRLRRAGAGDSVIAATLKRLAGIGLVDDLAFAQWIHGINRGVLLPPGLDEQWLISVLHSDDEANRYGDVFGEFVTELTGSS